MKKTTSFYKLLSEPKTALALLTQTLQNWKNTTPFSPNQKIDKAIETIKTAYINQETTLNLNYMDLTTLPPIFNFFPNLTALWANGNKLTELSQHTFGFLPNLQDLLLAKNQIKTIRQNTFQYLPSLDTLTLSMNRLENLDQNTFSGLSNLTKLHLDENQITTFSQDTFTQQPKLTYLSLNKNRIRDLGEGSFSTLNLLINLQLQDNEITELKTDTFHGLNSMVKLTLSNNRISALANNVFAPLFARKKPSVEINLSFNQINTITAATFSNVGQEAKFYILHNPLSPDLNLHSGFVLELKNTLAEFKISHPTENELEDEGLEC